MHTRYPACVHALRLTCRRALPVACAACPAQHAAHTGHLLIRPLPADLPERRQNAKVPGSKVPVPTWILAYGGVGIVTGLATCEMAGWAGLGCVCAAHSAATWPDLLQRMQLACPGMLWRAHLSHLPTAPPLPRLPPCPAPQMAGTSWACTVSCWGCWSMDLQLRMYSGLRCVPAIVGH